MAGIINLDIKSLKLNSFLQVKCLFLTENFMSFTKTMATTNYNSGLMRVKIG